MSFFILQNEYLKLQIDEFGAELTSIYYTKTNTEYLWQADPAFWKRHSPILFPFVGTLKDKSYTYQGNSYFVMQHGFARDMNFHLLSQTEDEIWLFLEATEETRQIYPFEFRLEIGYRLKGRKIAVLWRVINQGQEEMYFSIGGHPAFNCPLDPLEEQSNYFISFDTTNPIRYLHVNEKGLVEKEADKQYTLTMDCGFIPVDPHMFDYDALIIENHQCHKVTLSDPAKVPYLSISFDAPLFGLWSPAHKNAPFVCIEPWYGRCDANNFCGTLKDREYGNSLEAEGVFEAFYTIDIM